MLKIHELCNDAPGVWLGINPEFHSTTYMDKQRVIILAQMPAKLAWWEMADSAHYSLTS